MTLQEWYLALEEWFHTIREVTLGVDEYSNVRSSLDLSGQNEKERSFNTGNGFLKQSKKHQSPNNFNTFNH